MNILITGANGFFGRITRDRLFKAGHSISTLSRSKEASYMQDLKEAFSFDQNTSFDWVIHIAGKAHSIPKTDMEQQEFFKVNFEGTKNLCTALEMAGRTPESFIFISTVAVYGVDEGEDINESHPLNGASPYAESKVFAEQWLIDWANRNRIKLGILRLPLIAGTKPIGNFASMVRGINTRKYLSIGKANARKSIVWAEDVANILPKLAEEGGIFNLTDGYHPSFGELELNIANALNKRKPLKIPYWFANVLAMVGDRVGNRFPINTPKLKKSTYTLTFNDQKARTELGWQPTPVLSKIKEIIK